MTGYNPHKLATQTARRVRRQPAQENADSAQTPAQSEAMQLQQTLGNRRFGQMANDHQPEISRRFQLPPVRGIAQREAAPAAEKLSKQGEIEKAIALLADIRAKAEAPEGEIDTKDEKKLWNARVWKELGTSNSAYNRYKEGSGSEVMAAIGLIGTVRAQIDSLTPADLGVDAAALNDIKAKYHRQVNSFSPYYTQMSNANFLPKNNSKNAAWERTCNMTSMAMATNSVGVGPADFNGDKELLVKIASHFDAKLKDWATISALRMPDFLQLVVIYVKYLKETGDKFDEKVDNAQKAAAGVISSTLSVFTDVGDLFGLKRTAEGSIDSYGAQQDKLNDAYDSAQNVVSADYRKKKTELEKDQKDELKKFDADQKTKLDDLKQQRKKKEITAAVFKEKEQKLKDERIEKVAEHKEALAVLMQEQEAALDEAGGEQRKLQKDEKALKKQLELDKAKLSKDHKKELLALIAKQKTAVTALDLQFKKKQITKQDLIDRKKELSDARETLVKAYETAVAKLDAETGKQVAGLDKSQAEVEEKELGQYRTPAFVEQYKQAILTKITPLLNSGGQIILNEPGHYVRLEDISADGIVIDDPAELGKNFAVDWEAANKKGYFRSYQVFKKK